MSSLISADEVANLLPVTKSNLYTTACMYRKEHGVYPSWYIADSKVGASETFIDIDVLNEQSNLLKRCWLLSTDYLYWWLTDKMKMNRTQLSEALANRSKKFNTVGTWEAFFNQGLFNIPQEVVLIERDSRLRDFTIYGTAMVLAHHKRPVLHRAH